MGVLHSVGSRGAVQLDRYYGAVSRERVADLDTETSRNGGRSRILVAAWLVEALTVPLPTRTLLIERSGHALGSPG